MLTAAERALLPEWLGRTDENPTGDTPRPR